jgi:hypothetical protein
MSLKAFHIVFIGCAALLAFGVAAWALRAYMGGSGAPLLGAGICSLLVGAGLIFYGFRFLRKLKHVSFL